MSDGDELTRPGQVGRPSDPDQWRPEPLTRRNTDGQVYQRGADVERQIRECYWLPLAALRTRASITDQASAEYLQEECLVYLIRHFHAAGEARAVSDLSKELLRRCAKKIEGHLKSLGLEAVRTGYDDVVEPLFTQILDLVSDRGDFLQVRFWVVLERLAVHAFRTQLAAHKEAQATVPLSALAGYDRDESEEAERTIRTGADAQIASPSGEAAVIQSDLIRSALERIKEPFRSAYLLRHLFQWPVEDQDPSVQTISRHFNKDPRTIRNWLAKAETALEAWRGEQQ